jgi:flagellin-specific chaperone FliS
MLCSIKEFKEALEKAIGLFDVKVIESKNLNIKETKEIIKNLEEFLNILKSDIETNSIDTYEKLIIFLENLETTNKNLTPLAGYLGKILDVIQLLKPNTTRSKNAKKYFINSLKRTGHEFLFNELSTDEQKKLFDEIINSSALYILLEISNFAYSNTINPISSLRNSMGDRLPEEYFSELLAGWFIEDVFIKQLKNKGFEVNQVGIDTNRKILFKRPRNMGEADIQIKYKNKEYKIELQRVGKATKPTKINNTKNESIIKTTLKSHKITDDNVLTILWFGNNPNGIAEKNSFLYNKICIIKNSDINDTSNNKIYYKNDNIFIDKSYIDDNSILNWGKLKNLSVATLVKNFYLEE